MFEDKPPRKNPQFIVLDLFLREHYPAIFTKYIPMKIGIREDILKENPDIDPLLLGFYLGRHTRKIRYLKILANHDFRYDLQGVSVHQMTAEEKTYHVKRYLDYQQKTKKPQVKQVCDVS
jgi:sRNA-binding protein